jgi:hypothetical protein
MERNIKILENSIKMYDNTLKEMREKDVDKTIVDKIEKEREGTYELLNKIGKAANESLEKIKNKTECREVSKEDTVDLFFNNRFLLKLPEKYNINESDIKNVLHDRDKKLLFITVREIIGKNQIREVLKEYNKCWVKKIFSNENIILSHVNGELNNEYKTIFTNIKLKKIIDDMWSYNSDKIQTFTLVFKYKKEVIE